MIVGIGSSSGSSSGSGSDDPPPPPPPEDPEDFVTVTVTVDVAVSVWFLQTKVYVVVFESFGVVYVPEVAVFPLGVTQEVAFGDDHVIFVVFFAFTVAGVAEAYTVSEEVVSGVGVVGVVGDVVVRLRIALVRGPTTPVGEIPFLVWKSFSAATVAGPIRVVSCPREPGPV